MSKTLTFVARPDPSTADIEKGKRVCVKCGHREENFITGVYADPTIKACAYNQHINNPCGCRCKYPEPDPADGSFGWDAFVDGKLVVDQLRNSDLNVASCALEDIWNALDIKVTFEYET